MKAQQPPDNGREPHRPSTSCRDARATLGESWESPQIRAVVQATAEGFEGFGGERSDQREYLEEGRIQELRQHFADCAACGDEARALVDLDRVLKRDFISLEHSLAGPSDACIDATIGEALEPSTQQQLLKRLRRGSRWALWGTFYGLALLATSALLVAAYRALSNLG